MPNAFETHEKLVSSIFGVVKHDFATGIVSGDLNDSLIRLIVKHYRENRNIYRSSQQALARINSASGHSWLSLSNTSEEILSKLYQSHPVHFELCPFDEPILSLHSELRSMFAHYVVSPFAFVNTRAWITLPSAEIIGPNSPHLDGFEPGHLKIMIYPNGLSSESGSLWIKNHGQINSAPQGAAIIFRNSDVVHAGVPGLKHNRLAIEVTLMRTMASFPQLNRSHIDGRHLKNPYLVYKEAYAYTIDTRRSLLDNLVSPPPFINIGSGKRDWGSNWLLLDELDFHSVTSFRVSPECMFPYASGSADLIYTSHHLEHLGDDSVSQILSECQRCLKSGGQLLIKIPDYDAFLDAYEANQSDFYSGKGVESVMWSWKSKGVEESPLNMLSMMFCGYWNSFYGDHFSGTINPVPNAYHGPAPIDMESLKSLLDTRDPRQIVKVLSDIARNDPNFKAFNHQNAWSKAQIAELCSSHGFFHVSTNANHIMNRYNNIIPDLMTMSDWSMFALFEKP